MLGLSDEFRDIRGKTLRWSRACMGFGRVEFSTGLRTDRLTKIADV